jgi:6-phospho-beta-glucosidase
MLLANARAVRACRAVAPKASMGLVLNLSEVLPATDAPEDREAARIADGMLNRWFLEPAVLGTFPEDVVALYGRKGWMPEVSGDDLRLLSGHTVDWIGVNYYYPHHASAVAPDTRFHLNVSGRRDEPCDFSLAGLFRFVPDPRGRYTDWGWEIAPEALHGLLMRAHRTRPGIPVYVTENGIGRNEVLCDGTVADDERIGFVRDHLVEVHRAIADGANVRGYFMWSLMDNFSWLNGYRKRYGFLFVDRDTLARHPKKSAAWFREVARANGFG